MKKYSYGIFTSYSEEDAIPKVAQDNENMRENTIEDISERLSSILNNNRFQSRIDTANNNWLKVLIDEIIVL